MILWRLSGTSYADIFDSGYGRFNSGRWNSLGNPITYCATSPSLCVLEKLVHIEDTALLPRLTLVAYDVPDAILPERTSLADLPEDWPRSERLTQRLGDDWLARASSALMLVPSAVLPVRDSPDVNVLVNHAHPDSRRISIFRMQEFSLDSRLV